MKYQFDVPEIKAIRKSIYEEEYNLMKGFVDSEHQSLQFEYENEFIAQSAWRMVWIYSRKEGLPIKVTRAKNIVRVVRV